MKVPIISTLDVYKGGRFRLDRHEMALLLKFQLLTKSLLSVIVVPAYYQIAESLLALTGRVAISTGDLTQVLKTPQGILALILAVAATILCLLFDMEAFFLAFTGKCEYSLKELVSETIQTLKSTTVPLVNLILMAFEAGLTVLILRLFRGGYRLTGKFYRYLAGTPSAKVILGIVYVLLLIVLLILGFTFPYVLFDELDPSHGMKESVCLFFGNFKEAVKEAALETGLVIVMIGLPILGLVFVVPLTSLIRPLDVHVSRFFMLFLTLFFCLWILFALMMSLPRFVKWQTYFFMDHHEQPIVQIPLEEAVVKKDRRSLTRIMTVFTSVIVVLSVLGTVFFGDLFRKEADLQVVAHRAGGDLDVENSLEGLKKAIDQGAYWAEIDVQRSRDGVYYINHDSTFKRMAGNKHYVWDLTSYEINDLRISDSHNQNVDMEGNIVGVHVPTLEEMMDEADGKIGLFIELKGQTADYQMCRDVIQMIRQRHMEDSTAILSMNYKLIEYIEDTNPDIRTGYLYYLTFDSGQRVRSNFMVMEMGNATSAKINSIHMQGKKAYVWTVNSDVSINNILSLPVDGIITDRVKRAQELAAQRLQESDFSAVMKTLMNWFL